MKKFEGILICTDLDGTLLRNDKTISEENLKAIEYFKSEGGIFTFNTGRLPCMTTKFYDIVKPNAPACSLNGAGIYDIEAGEYILKYPLSRSYTELLESVNEALPDVGYLLFAFYQEHVCKENEEVLNYRRVKNVSAPVTDYREIEEDIAKILLVIKAGDEELMAKAAELLDRHPKADEFDFIRSELTLYEILPKDVSKGKLLLKLADILNVDIKNTYAIGDYNNDVSMLKVAGVGIAVANATEEAKAAADFVTVSNEDDAIARVIYGIEKGEFKKQ